MSSPQPLEPPDPADPPDPLVAELRFRALLDEADLPAPDSVEHHEGEIVFLWHDRKVAVIVDLVAPDVRLG